MQTAEQRAILVKQIAKELLDRLTQCGGSDYFGEVTLSMKIQAGVPQVWDFGDVRKRQVAKS